MKVLMVNDHELEGHGGAASYVLDLMKELERRGHTTFLYYPQTRANIFGRIFNFSSFLKIKKILNEQEIDIAHFHEIFFNATPSTILAADLFKIPSLITVHDYGGFCPEGRFLRKNNELCNKFCMGVHCFNCVLFQKAIYFQIKYKIQKQILRKVSCFLSPSKFVRRVLEANGFKRIIVFPYAIDTRKFKFTPLKQNHQILFVGRLVKEKGCEYLLQAFPEIVKEINDAKLLIVGEGPEKKKLMRLARELKIRKRVEFVGWIPRERINYYYQNSNLLVVPSVWYEVCGIVILEAFATGRPVVASRIGGIPDVINDNLNGYLVEPKNPNQLAKKIINILSDKDLAVKMGRKGRKLVEEKYNIKTHVNKHLKIYKQLT